MGKSVVPDFMPLAVNAVGDVGKLVGLDSDQEEGGRRLFALEHIENFGRPFRVGAVVEGNGDLVRA